ncbi:MAG: hypothetical protein IT378_11470 [Sandaracinaceae bacterium]|nr:hypothetical protein [Sandaracinaceae bacterium]
MLVLLMTTATATFAIHSTSVEIRASGHLREAMQTQYVAEGGLLASMELVDSIGAQSMYLSMSRTPSPAGTRLAPEEPAFTTERHNFRVYMTDFASTPGVYSPPIELDAARTPSLGPRGAYQPRFTVDVNDDYQSFQADPGRRSDGYGVMMYLSTTFTARGRMAPPSDYQAAGDARTYPETASNARAFTEIGPLPRM